MPMNYICMPSGEVLVGLAIRKSFEDFEKKKRFGNTLISASTLSFGTYRIRFAAKAQASLHICVRTLQSIRCSHTLGMGVDEGSGQNLDL